MILCLMSLIACSPQIVKQVEWVGCQVPEIPVVVEEYGVTFEKCREGMYCLKFEDGQALLLNSKKHFAREKNLEIILQQLKETCK
jgi:hypothetical protein